MRLREVGYIFMKDLRLELRQGGAIGQILLYAAGAVFVSYQAFVRVPDRPTWNALFWVIMLFSGFQAGMRTFGSETAARRYYLYTLVAPESVLLGKWLFSFASLLVIVGVSFVLFAALIGGEALAEAQLSGLAVVLVLGALALSSTLTLVSALSAQTGNVALTAILGMPVLLPTLVLLIRLSKNVLDGIAWSVNGTYALQLAGVSLLSVALSYILFPYLWQE